MRERTVVSESAAAMPKVEQGVTQTDIEQYGMACYEVGRKDGRRDLRDELKAKRPTLEDEQRRGRSLLWDRQIDLGAEEAYDESRVPQQAYVYQTHQP